MKQGPAGETVVLPAELKPGRILPAGVLRQFVDARQRRENPIAAGQRARIERVDGLTLVVHGEHS